MTLRRSPMVIALLACMALAGCTNKTRTTVIDAPATVSFQHLNGTTDVKKHPQRVVVLDYASLETLQLLGVEPLALPGNRTMLPDSLKQYQDAKYLNAGTLFEPDMATLRVAKPDLILIAGRSSKAYAELSAIAPTLNMAIDPQDQLGSLKQRTLQLGELFDKQQQAQAAVDKLDAEIAAIKPQVANAGRGLVVLFSGGKISGNCASVSPIGHDGVVVAPIQQIDGLTAPHSANIDPTNQLLLEPCLKEDRIRLFNLDLQGELTPHSQEAVATASGAGPRHMAFHHNDKYAYCVNELDGTVDVLAISENGGKYTLVQTLDIMPSDFNGTRWAADIHITPNGRFLYTSDRTASILTIFSVSEDGSTLSVVGYHPTEEQPRGFNIDHSGRFVISSGQKSGHIGVYEIDQASGKLTTLARYPVGKGPMWVSVLDTRHT